ncbi:hypothetical protein [Azospirillum picis]|uniref:Uncharacterized protein n=1 Tax=Azospirillum picis TaxID=488438 RepID=A0ABU0MPH4_9PROT|nr:hypothetical protein [Azospirillum picis]MBP2301542.1 hypothetical protein [Azospirillum picis]MDQ0535374.1 hypothetical protein [Azospirillum picis]
MKPCRCPCGLAVDLRAVAAPGCYWAACDSCLDACSAALRDSLRRSVEGSRSASLAAAARMLAEANQTTAGLSPVRRERADA